VPEPQPPPSRPARVRWASLAAIAIALAAAAVNLKQESDYQGSSRDPYLVNAQADRLAGIASAVPADAVLGYVTDLAPGTDPYKSTFQTARYALAPRLLVPEGSGLWVLGNFSRPADFAALGRSKGLELVQDFGNGAVLFRRPR
jgi:hypothetical protein